MTDQLGNTGFTNHHQKCKERAAWQANNRHTRIAPGDWCQVGIEEADIVEYMWVKIMVDSEDNKTLAGFIDNDPVFISVKQGTPVMFTRDEIVSHIKENELKAHKANDKSKNR